MGRKPGKKRLSKKHAPPIDPALASRLETAVMSFVVIGLLSCAAPPPCDCGHEAAAPAEDASAVSDRPAIVHEVRSGDTLAWIAQGYGVTIEAIARINEIRDPHSIGVGQRLRLPPGAELVHAVRAGETLASIAASHAVPVSTIVDRNGLGSEGLAVGQILVLPPEARLPAPRLAPADRASRAKRQDGSDRMARADALLRVAEERYRSAHFDLARDLAREAGTLLEGVPGSANRRARAHFVEGSALAGLGRDDEARTAFEQLQAIDRDFAPPSDWLSPRIRALYPTATNPESDR